MLARAARAGVDAGEPDRAARTTSCARRCTRSIRLTPTIVEVVVQGAAGGARLPARASSIGCRISRRWRRSVDGTALAMEGLALTGASVDRERGLLSTIVLEMGGSSDLCALLQARRAGGPDGPDRHADRDAVGRDRAAGRRRTRQCGAVLDRADAARDRLAASSTSPATRRSIDRYKVEEIERAADVVVWCCDEAPGFTPDRAAGPGLRRQHRRGDGGLCVAASSATGQIPLQRRRPHHRDRLRRHDGAVGAGAPRRAEAVSQARTITAIGSHQLADAVHDEGDLRAVPAAAQRSGDRRGDASCSPASTRTSRSTTSTSATCARACRRTACRRS